MDIPPLELRFPGKAPLIIGPVAIVKRRFSVNTQSMHAT